ncbi:MULTISPECIES: hypothetical protein [unclassified Herbaspirillum]|uniref:hypothetical protein n=1 Tax=unclassified Herbaspirillum TaxID=2624150 RepID=UPI000E2F9DF9|nr:MULTISPECIES: hypothetical protein [unclassified Herbaspirillum]RFB70877.1 hypothetical protein DZB54_09635 [Herbaspirillum sp. 3R-3a1]TFI08601.1 hypothetical protein E4P32_10630 [Herbaspirillum sp. 3R11]TFI15015.1 hypothetical protein E4P31_10625 [Herbaspirillum sp. 3R-11]TFI18744.1 hypothetical protein E4P30_25730 [Herbaspirillum sp. 3C11]
MIQTPYRRYQASMKPLHLQLGVIADQERMAAEGLLGPITQVRWDAWNEQRTQIHKHIGASAIALDVELQNIEKLTRSLVKKHALGQEESDRICYFLESGWSEDEVRAEILKIQKITIDGSSEGHEK